MEVNAKIEFTTRTRKLQVIRLTRGKHSWKEKDIEKNIQLKDKYFGLHVIPLKASMTRSSSVVIDEYIGCNKHHLWLDPLSF